MELETVEVQQKIQSGIEDIQSALERIKARIENIQAIKLETEQNLQSARELIS